MSARQASVRYRAGAGVDPESGANENGRPRAAAFDE